MKKRSSEKAQQIIEGKVFTALSYLSFLCIIPLIFNRDDSFVLKHSKQGLILFLGEVTVFIVHIILGLWILYFGMAIFIILSSIGLIISLQGREVELPIVSRLADAVTL